MITRTFISALFLLVCTFTQAQSMIGMSKEEVKERFKLEFTDFNIDNTTQNQVYNYLRYINDSETITWIVFFSDDEKATLSKKVCDYSEYDFVLEELQEKCEEVDDMMWEYESEGETYFLTLEEKDWYFIVREKKK